MHHIHTKEQRNEGKEEVACPMLEEPKRASCNSESKSY